MTSKTLFELIKPTEQHEYVAQLNAEKLSFNTSDMFSRLIKEAANCKGYNSDIFYDLNYLEESFNNFNPAKDFEPIWFGFRELGVDCTSFVLCRTSDKSIYGSLAKNYFALYSLSIKRDNNYDWYVVSLNKYPV